MPEDLAYDLDNLASQRIKTKPTGQLLSNMLMYATTKHFDQFDKSGKPYILHCIAVMQLLPSNADEELQCIALGHDLVEDCKVTYEELTEKFTPRIVEGIRSVTKQLGETFEEYKAKVKDNRDGVQVKIADLRHNSDITRLKGITQKDLERTAKYHSFFIELVQLST